MSEAQTDGVRTWVVIAALVAILFVLGLHWFVAALTCDTDTSYCATSSKKDGFYAGSVRSAERTTLWIGFESRRSADPRLVGPVSTDNDGGYCIRWAQERIVPYAALPDGREVALRDPWRNGPAPPGCQDVREGVPWKRADDLTSDIRYWWVQVLGLLGAALLAAGLIGPQAWRAGARRFGLIAAAPAVCGALVFIAG